MKDLFNFSILIILTVGASHINAPWWVWCGVALLAIALFYTVPLIELEGELSDVCEKELKKIYYEKR